MKVPGMFIKTKYPVTDLGKDPNLQIFREQYKEMGVNISNLASVLDESKTHFAIVICEQKAHKTTNSHLPTNTYIVFFW